ncbi:siderophore-interacting protein [Streptomyces sp. NPDC091279]|uniref:siderophore-interacting protein n=1 Tax=Streptomyces sp. NPDC091279 TaxID=3365983 RepID=UPI003802F0F7
MRVARTERLTPLMVRITFAGDTLDGFVGGGYDQRCKLMLPRTGQAEPVLSEDADAVGWFEAWRRTPEEIRPVMRTYTVRAQRPHRQEVDIDFALHEAPDGTSGPATRWARAATAGDRILLCGPADADAGGVDFRPPEGTAALLLAGDETALPAIAATLEGLARDGAGDIRHITVLAEVDGPEGEFGLPTVEQAETSLRWLHRGHGPSQLAEAVRSASVPEGRVYAWVAAEASVARGIRRQLVDERGLDRTAVTFKGYWRAGFSEDDD